MAHGILAGLFAFLCVLIFAERADAQYDPVDDTPSRQELFFGLKVLETGSVNFAAEPTFMFPDNVEENSVFGIDVSYNNEYICKCKIDWNDVVSRKVSFVYLRSSAGSEYIDKTYTNSIVELRNLQSQGKVHVGAYHFLRANADAERQAIHFLNVVKPISTDDMPPSLDLEWHPVQLTPNCPQNANLVYRDASNNIITKCDLWYTVPAKEILLRVNKWIDIVKAQSGRDPIVYTNAVWWNQRIGDPALINSLHTGLIWISEYPNSWPTKLKPKVPNAHKWVIWQFSDTAKISSGTHELTVDASMSPASQDQFEKQLGIGGGH